MSEDLRVRININESQDVHYLMIVNMPTDAEIAEAKEMLLRESMV